MHSAQTIRRVNRVAAACIALVALCLWPVLDIDGRPAHHAAAGRVASHRGSRGVSRSECAPAGHLVDEGLVAAPAEAGMSGVVAATSHAPVPAIIAELAPTVVPLWSSPAPWSVDSSACLSPAGTISSGRAPPLA